MKEKLKWVAVGLASLGCGAGWWLEPVSAAELRKIDVQGLQYLPKETVIAALPMKIGAKLTSSSSDEVLKALHSTGLFRDIAARVDGSTLRIVLSENRVIGEIKVIGNRAIKRKMIDHGLRQLNLVVGRPINYSSLHQFKQAMLAQYRNLGIKDAQINFDQQQEERNRVKLIIQINEGAALKIGKINFIGNHKIAARKLRKELESKSTGIFSWLTDDDVYSPEKIARDVEKIKRFYYERGYLGVQVDEPVIKWIKGGKKALITFTIRENQPYHIKTVRLTGDMAGKGNELQSVVTLRSGDVASVAAVEENERAIRNKLGDFGYGLAMTRPDYKLDHKARLVEIELLVIPGKRVVARKIDFRGNIKTRDEVLRREMRVQEGGSFSRDRLLESQRKLANLGYLQDVTYEVSEVEDADNQVDVVYNFKEVSSTSFNMQVGITDYRGLVYGASLSDINFLGTGRSASVNFNNSNSSQSYGIHYFDPYFTDDQLGFGVDATIDIYNPHRVDKDLSGYRRRTYGLVGRFSLPLSDYASVYYGAGFERVSIPGRPNVNVNPKIEKFLDRYGSSFNNLKLVTGVSCSTLDRAIFPRKGYYGAIDLEGYVPIARRDLGFYRGSANGVFYYPIYGDWVARLNAEISYGRGYGKFHELPFFRNYFAGGIGSVRGFESGTLSSEEDAHCVIGGNFLTLGSAALIVPSLYPDTLRISAFVDAGHIFNNRFNAKDLRMSAGVQLEVRTPIAPMTISFARPIRKKAWDQVERFQFSISTSM